MLSNHAPGMTKTTDISWEYWNGAFAVRYNFTYIKTVTGEAVCYVTFCYIS